MKQGSAQPTICLLGGTFETRNLGVSALTAGAVRCILEAFPNAEVFLLDYGKKRVLYNVMVGCRVVAIELVNMRFSKRIFLSNNITSLLLVSLLVRAVPLHWVRTQVTSRNFCLNKLDRADVVASIAGGDSFSDIYGLRRFFYMALPQLLALLRGKKLVLLPQTVGPFHSRLVKAVAKFIVEHASLVYSRDSQGLDNAKNIVQGRHRAKIKFNYDMGFALEAFRPKDNSILKMLQGARGQGQVVGLNVSGLLFVGGYSQNNMFRLIVDYRQLINRLIKFLIEEKSASVILVPHVSGSTDHLESDATACRLVYDELKNNYKDNLRLVGGVYDQHEIKYIIGLCNFFIGSRMHACIAALSQNVPAVGLAYSEKFRGVFESIGLGFLVADLRELDMAGIKGVVNSAFEGRRAVREELEVRMSDVKKSVLNLFREILEPDIPNGRCI